MADQEVIMGTMNPMYRDGKAQMITFCVTEECNLRCKYCYMTGKNAFNRMSIDVAKKAVDFFLHQPIEEEAVIWDFIGGEPTLEMELIDEISDYIKQQMYLLDHPWFNNYIFSVGTNGLLYRTKSVQDYLTKNAGHVSFSITIDGTKDKHDLMRIKSDGRGSYDEVYKSVMLWQQQFPGMSTKVTFASDDLKYLKDSIIHLWNIGLDRIPANVVFEDVWKEGDDIIYEEQLRALADFIVEHRLYYTKSVRFFDPSVGFPLGKRHKQVRFCGSGKMMAVDSAGDIFPCIRFLDFCIPNKPPLKTGSIYSGFEEERRKAFKSINIEILNDGECANCPVASGCFSCTGCNYAYASENTIFTRTKFHCAMQKAQVRANEYFWNRFTETENRISPHEIKRKEYYESEGWAPDGAKYLYFIVNDNCVSVCHYRAAGQGISMSKEVLEIGLLYAEHEHMVPVFIGDPYSILGRAAKKKLHVVVSDRYNQEIISNPICEFIPVYNGENHDPLIESNSCILSIDREHLSHLADISERIGGYSKRINLKFTDLNQWKQSDFDMFRTQLNKLGNGICEKLNVFSYLLNGDRSDSSCKAGISEFALAPNGKLYPCPGYYFELPAEEIGVIDKPDTFKMIEVSMYDHSKSLQCRDCPNSQCEQCTLQNRLMTGFKNLPSDSFCRIFEIGTKRSVSVG